LTPQIHNTQQQITVEEMEDEIIQTLTIILFSIIMLIITGAK